MNVGYIVTGFILLPIHVRVCMEGMERRYYYCITPQCGPLRHNVVEWMYVFNKGELMLET